MKDQTIQDFATALDSMTEDEIFTTMLDLEKESEEAEGDVLDEVLARIALTEEMIEQRFPGQAMTPYRNWKQRQAF